MEINFHHISGQEIFTFTWRIENFSMCPQQFGEWINSPTFKVPFLSNTVWRLRIYPRGDKKANHIACYLQRTDSKYTKPVTIGCSITALSVHKDKDIKKNIEMFTFGIDCSCDFSDFSSREDIFISSSDLLPSDALTLKCRMWKYKENAASVLPDCMNTCCWNSYEHSKLSESKAVTRIKVNSITVLWPIRRFCELQPNKTLKKHVVSIMENDPSFELKFFVTGKSAEDQCAHLEIRRINPKGPIFVRGEIKTIGAPKKAVLQARSEYYFESSPEFQQTEKSGTANSNKPSVLLPNQTGGNQLESVSKGVKNTGRPYLLELIKKLSNNKYIWYFPVFIKTEDLLKKNYLSYTGGILYLQCSFSFSNTGYNVITENFDTTYPISFIDKNNSLRINYQELYKDEKFSDIILRVEGRDFKAHKNILALRSDVFRTMFEANMRERESGIIEISDMDAETVEQLLIFLYTDTLEEDLRHEDALSLYSAADKYIIASLKWQCCCILISTLCVSNVCGVLNCAHLHQDEDLLEAAQTFVYKNANETFHSKNWKHWMQSNPQLASETMHCILTKNVG